jgi:hypothetical protein
MLKLKRKPADVHIDWWCNTHKCRASWDTHVFCDTDNLHVIPTKFLTPAERRRIGLDPLGFMLDRVQLKKSSRTRK